MTLREHEQRAEKRRQQAEKADTLSRMFSETFPTFSPQDAEYVRDFPEKLLDGMTEALQSVLELHRSPEFQMMTFEQQLDKIAETPRKKRRRKKVGEKRGKELGQRLGRVSTLARQLSAAFGEFSPADAARLEKLPDEALDELTDAIALRRTWADIRKLLRRKTR